MLLALRFHAGTFYGNHSIWKNIFGKNDQRSSNSEPAGFRERSQMLEDENWFSHSRNTELKLKNIIMIL